MFETSIAGSLPKPAWLAETNKLWPQWQIEGDALLQAKADATLLWIKAQEDAGLDIVSDGEQSRQHFVHGFLEQIDGIDFEHKVKMGIRDNRYDAMVPQVVAALRLKGRVHAAEARLLQVLKQLWVLHVDIRLSAHMQSLRFRPRAYSYVGDIPFLDLARQADRQLEFARQGDRGQDP